MNYLEFEKIIGYTFKNKELLKKALTHSSAISPGQCRITQNNERLEFLGDAFFDAIIGVEIFEKMPLVGEGVLTKTRAKIVCEGSLAEQGLRLGIGDYMLMGKGEELHGGRQRTSIVADAMEAVIGAIFIDGGYYAAQNFVSTIFADTIKKAVRGKLDMDYKTVLQEKLQSLYPYEPPGLKYVVAKEEGPDHDKKFYIDLYYHNNLIGKGEGKSKKEAERSAAKVALERGDDFVF